MGNLGCGGNATTTIVIAIVAAVVLIAIILLSWYISTSNWFNRAKVTIDESKSSIDVALTKRYDLLTKSLATVKGYAKHESETLMNVIKMRNQNGLISDLSMEEKSKLASKMSEATKQLNVVMEQYPELKADKAFVKLQDQSSDCEDDLQAARRIFNNNVKEYNQKIVTFPSSIVACMKHLTKEAFFEAEASKKEDVKFDF